MNEKEIREIRRRFRPEKSNIPSIVGCFVNGNKNIIARISQSMALSETFVSEKLLGVMKKTLSGSLGTNLTEISFSTKEVESSEEHALLMALRKSRLSDNEALEKFYARVSESIEIEGNYVILLANDVYDVPSYSSDGEDSGSSESFSYLICAICPVKSMPEAISFKESDSLFHTMSASALLAAPELGFMFPLFDDRKTNIYGALYYTRNLGASYPDFTEKILLREHPMPPKVQKETFGECLCDALSEECSLEVVKQVHSELCDMVSVHKESHNPEPLVITKETVRSVLAGCGIDDGKLAKLDKKIDESFGAGKELSPKNIIPTGRFDITMPEISIKIKPDHRDRVSTQIIDGEKYVMIKVTGPVEVNGVEIALDEGGE